MKTYAIRFPWRTVHATTPSRLRAYYEILKHEALELMFGSERAHARPAAVRYALGVPTPAGLPGLRGANYRPVIITDAHSVSDGVTTNGDETLTSASAPFTDADVGRVVIGAGIPSGTSIVSVTAPDEVELSAQATADATGVTVEFRDPEPSNVLPGALWIQRVIVDAFTRSRVLIRDPANNVWLPPDTVVIDDDGHVRGLVLPYSGDQFEIQGYNAEGQLTNDISIHDDAQEYIHYDGNGNKLAEIAIGDTGSGLSTITLNGADGSDYSVTFGSAENYGIQFYIGSTSFVVDGTNVQIYGPNGTSVAMGDGTVAISLSDPTLATINGNQIVTVDML